MIATANHNQPSTSYSTWSDSIPHRPYSKSTASDRSSVTNLSHMSGDTSASTMMTSPTDSTMSGPSSTLVALPGKKRKRLQRACVACHKAKRRCDGGLPCSNCDFSGRSCAYSDAQGKAVPPTKRTLKPSEVALQRQERHFEASPSHLGQHGAVHGTIPPSTASTSSALHYSPPLYAMQRPPASYSDPRYSPISNMRGGEPSMVLPMPYSPPRSYATHNASYEARRELLHIFVEDVQPWSCIVDDAALFRSLSVQSTPSALLAAVYALSAQHTYLESRRISPNTARYERLSSLLNEVGDGSHWAEESRRALYQQDNTTGSSAVDGDISIDTAQALALLACFEHGYRRIETSTAYIRVASKFVVAQTASSSAGMLAHYQGDVAAVWQAKRLVSMIALLDVVLGVMSGRGSSLHVWELESAVGAVDDASEDDDFTTKALAQQLKTALIFCSAHQTHNRATKLAVRSKSRAPALETASTSNQARACEAYLQAWADALPGRLRFEEQSLHEARRAFRPESVTYASTSNTKPFLIWSGIHLCAEAAILLLQDATETELSLAAAHNMAMILEIIPPAALSGPLGTFGIAVLKAAAVAGEHAASRRLSSTSEGTGITTRKPWIDLEQTSDALAREAHVGMWMHSVVKGLAFGALHDASTFAKDSMPEMPQRGTMSSWARSPESIVRPGLLRIPSATRSTQERSDEHTQLPPLLRARSTSGGKHTLAVPRQAGNGSHSEAGASAPRSPITLPPLRIGTDNPSKQASSSSSLPWRSVSSSIAASETRHTRD